MLTECHEVEQYIIISLKEDIKIETVIMVNRELYSSTINEFEVKRFILLSASWKPCLSS